MTRELKMKKQKTKGFHLIEIMIALAIISILAAIALPSYLHHLVRAKRLEAETQLTKLAIAMEKYHVENNSYQNASLAVLNFPDVVARGNYKLNITKASDNDYVLTANPIGKQAEDTCGQLLLYSNGDKKITGDNAISKCW